MIVSIDREHCRVMVLSRRLPVGMIREGGKWRMGEYSADDIQDFFESASGSEAEMWFEEASLAYRKVLEKNMSVSVMKFDRVSDKGGRRTGIDRREFSFTAYGPERRNSDDRREYDDRREKPRKEKTN